MKSLKLKKEEQEKALLVAGGILLFAFTLWREEMMTISYIPFKDELIVKFRPVTGRPTKILGSFKLWWDDDGNICAIVIMSFTEKLEDFRRNLNTVRLGSIWKGVKITNKEIKEAREELLKKLEEKW